MVEVETLEEIFVRCPLSTNKCVLQNICLMYIMMQGWIEIYRIDSHQQIRWNISTGLVIGAQRGFLNNFENQSSFWPKVSQKIGLTVF